MAVFVDSYKTLNGSVTYIYINNLFAKLQISINEKLIGVGCPSIY
jgi:hypothetical protein